MAASMSSSEPLGIHAAQALAAAEAALAQGKTSDIPDEAVQQLLLAGVKLFAHKVDTEGRYFRPVPETATMTATEVAVMVTELLNLVGLNLFDLAMWSGRARPDTGPDTGNNG